jgi:predicted ArsR family transcriptional regulator
VQDDPATSVGTVGRRRAVVLGVLHELGGPVSAREVAERTGLHLNTARFHLDRLVADGLAARAGEARATPGRPRILYAAAGPGSDPRSYALLAEMLTGLVADLKEAAPIVTRTGRAWGRHLVERPAPSERLDATEATARVVRVLDGIGFRPQVQVVPDGVHLLLHHCPFREVAERHADVVCAMHLALIEGALEELRAPLRATGLDPFLEPSLCRARLGPAPVG